MTQEFINHQKALLLALLERLGASSASNREVKHGHNESGDFIDSCSFVTEVDNSLSLVNNAHKTIQEINSALGRIKAGTYGICEYSGEEIPIERLEAIPWAKFTVKAQAEFEKTGTFQERPGNIATLFDETCVDSEDEAEEE
jgi:RNA polymerase-binding protein DksA